MVICYQKYQTFKEKTGIPSELSNHIWSCAKPKPVLGFDKNQNIQYIHKFSTVMKDPYFFRD
jgi:hypothetical protein